MANEELEKWIRMDTRRRYWRKVGAGFITGVIVVIIVLLILTMTGCYPTSGEVKQVQDMPETTPEERAAKNKAFDELKARADSEENWWMLSKIAIGLLLPAGVVAVERAHAARKLSLAGDAMVGDITELTNLMPQVDRDAALKRMAAKHDAAGVRDVIRKKVQKARGKA